MCEDDAAVWQALLKEAAKPGCDLAWGQLLALHRAYEARHAPSYLCCFLGCVLLLVLWLCVCLGALMGAGVSGAACWPGVNYTS